jgi:hypothetical protein
LFAGIKCAIHIFITYIYFYTIDIVLICVKENAQQFSTFLILGFTHNAKPNVYNYIQSNNNRGTHDG